VTDEPKSGGGALQTFLELWRTAPNLIKALATLVTAATGLLVAWNAISPADDVDVPMPAPPSVYIDDTDPSADDWQTGLKLFPSTANHTEMRSAGNGEMRIRWELDEPRDEPWAIASSFWHTRCWNPEVDGAIESITLSIDRALRSATSGQQDLLQAQAAFTVKGWFLLRQGEQEFMLEPVDSRLGAASTTYTTARRAEVRRDDFAAPQLNFASGDPICFGVIHKVDTDLPDGLAVQIAFDNFRVEVFPLSQ